MSDTRSSRKQTATAPRPTAPESTEAPEQAETPDGVHVVTEGETLEQIAEETGVPAAQLQRLNAIKRPALIWPGMRLRTR